MWKTMALKILWFNWRCWLNPAMGGAEVFTHEVAKRWVAQGNEVTLFTSKFEGAKDEEVVDGIRIIRAGGRFSVYREAQKYYSKRFVYENFDFVVDEINTHPFFAQKMVKSGEKVVALIHQLACEFWFYETPFPISYIGYYYLENHWLKQYVDVPTVTVSESTKQDLLDLGFNDVSIVPEGLNFEPSTDIPLKNQNPVVVFLGRLTRAKRPDHAIRAFKCIRERFPLAELWIFGDGPLRNKLESYNLSGVKFFGNLESSKRRSLLAKTWLHLVPGVREGWGLNVVECNALGVPSVAYNVPGLRDSVKEGKTGFLVRSGDFEDLAEKAIAILEDAKLRQVLSLSALRYAKTFSWDKTASEMIQKFRAV
jgi:glycosyltransferase involved in cell wall biosynthesis